MLKKDMVIFMPNRRLQRENFAISAELLAPLLLGKYICRRTENGVISAMITETECYRGEEDTACHASKGKTARNAPMYLEGGHLYVYLCYGIHHLINIVSGNADFPEAVLIRGVKEAQGPGRASKYLGITTDSTGIDICEGGEIWIEDRGINVSYRTSKRVGIDYAEQKDRDKLWRFIMIDP